MEMSIFWVFNRALGGGWMNQDDFFTQLRLTTVHFQIVQNPAQAKLINEMYALWCITWKHVFAEKGLNDAVNTDDFCRQHVAQVLQWKGHVIGFIMGTIFDSRLDSHARHSYLASLDLDNLKEHLPRPTSKILSME